MKRILTAFALVMFAASPVLAITDSTGNQTPSNLKYGDTVYSSTWDRVSGKPSTFPSTWNQVSGKPSSYPTTWSQVSGKPSTFKPEAHHHDSRYIRRDASGSISGNLSVSGTVSGNRLVTGDVGGERWCRANSAGRVQCTHSAPVSGTRALLEGTPDVIWCNETVFQLRSISQNHLKYMRCGTGKSARCGDISFKRNNAGTYDGMNRKGAFSSNIGVCKEGLRAASQAGRTNVPYKYVP